MRTSTSICSLFFSGRPAAIAGFVVPVVVRVAINRVLRGWRIAHVAVKSVKGIKPFLAHRDAATRIVLPISRVPNAILGVLPRSPDFRAPFGVFRLQVPYDFLMQTSAALTPAIAQGLLPRNGFIPAITAATPTDSTIRGIRGTFNHGQASEPLANQIFNWRHWPPIA